MIPRPFDVISEPDILELCRGKAEEGRTLEFKRELPGGQNEDMREFLADVTSLANAQGGDLVFGIDDVKGVATSAPGVDPPDVEKEILRLENLLRDSVDPRLSGVRFRWIALSTGGGAMVVRAPGSLTGPHRVRPNDRFYGRNSLGKYPMDAHELRVAFTASEGLPGKLRAMHEEAFSGAAPFRLFDAPHVMVSVIPLSALRELRDIDPTPETALAPVRPQGALDSLHTLEGVVLHTPPDPNHMPDYPQDFVRTYALTHRRGHMHAGWAIGAEREVRKGVTSRLVFAGPFENDLVGICRSAIARLRAFGLDGPWAILTTIDRICDFELIVSDEYYSQPAWRTGAALPEVVVDEATGTSLLPILKAFWLLFGLVRPNDRAID